MARLCPITGTKVVYLECQECDDKVCRNPASSRTPAPEIKLEHHMQELIALQITQNHFGRLTGELTGAQILHSQEGKWYPEFPDKPTKQQKAVLDEAAAIVNAIRERYDLKDLSLKIAGEKFVKGEHGMHKITFYEKCFYIIIFDRKVVEEWYGANIESILQETTDLIQKGVITYPKEEWEPTDSQGYSYDVSIYVGEYIYYGGISFFGPDPLDKQVARWLVCSNMDAYLADFLKEHGVYE